MRRITPQKLKNLENLKSNLSKYNYPDSLIKQGFQEAFSIPQKDLRKPKKPSNENTLPFITTFNPNNSNIYSTIKSSVNCLKNNRVSGFQNIKLIQSKRQTPNHKKFYLKQNLEKFYRLRLTVVIKDVNAATTIS